MACRSVLGNRRVLPVLELPRDRLNALACHVPVRSGDGGWRRHRGISAGQWLGGARRARHQGLRRPERPCLRRGGGVDAAIRRPSARNRDRGERAAPPAASARRAYRAGACASSPHAHAGERRLRRSACPRDSQLALESRHAGARSCGSADGLDIPRPLGLLARVVSIQDGRRQPHAAQAGRQRPRGSHAPAPRVLRLPQATALGRQQPCRRCHRPRASRRGRPGHPLRHAPRPLHASRYDRRQTRPFAAGRRLRARFRRRQPERPNQGFRCAPPRALDPRGAFLRARGRLRHARRRSRRRMLESACWGASTIRDSCRSCTRRRTWSSAHRSRRRSGRSPWKPSRAGLRSSRRT